MNAHAKLLSVLIAGLAAASPALSSWDTGGDQVVYFPNTAGTDKIVFSHITFENAGTNNVAYLKEVVKPNPLLTPQPTHWLPGIDYKVSKVKAVRLNSTGPVIYAQVGKSAIPARCTKGDPNCAAAGLLTGTQTCTYNEFSLNLNGSVQAGPVSLPVSFGGTAGYTKGFARCALEADLISCPSPKSPAYDTLTFSTIEERTQFGQHRIYALNSISFKGGTSAQRRYCEDSVGGKFSGQILGSIGNASCDIGNFAMPPPDSKKPSWVQNERSPLAQTPEVGQCRIIKAL